ncbi:hypothetical protein MPLB_300012 [Mesorhizobium sp. ORS 3324]|nr:hypothetical protein MPLB_300012 [Mesorhizobium sp. ORS 3324]
MQRRAAASFPVHRPFVKLAGFGQPEEWHGPRGPQRTIRAGGRLPPRRRQARPSGWSALEMDPQRWRIDLARFGRLRRRAGRRHDAAGGFFVEQRPVFPGAALCLGRRDFRFGLSNLRQHKHEEKR